jgi:hypothetical protein
MGIFIRLKYKRMKGVFMLLKLKRFGEGVWFDYPEGGRFKIRAITPKRYLEISEVCKKGKQIIKNTENEDQIVDDFNESQRAWLIFSEAVQEYDALDSVPGSTPDQIREDIFNNRDLRDWIMDRASQVFKAEEKAVEGELKNSVTSHHG